MNRATPTTPTEPQSAARVTSGWRVRPGTHEDLLQIVSAVHDLLTELGGNMPATADMQEATSRLLNDSEAGIVLVAESNGVLVGVLAASWQTAIHAAGRYALIQDLWVHPDWRGCKLGAALLSGLSVVARKNRIARLEVGLPSELFAGIDATKAFYIANCFTSIGPRMRLELP